jgi:hypothetical protein
MSDDVNKAALNYLHASGATPSSIKSDNGACNLVRGGGGIPRASGPSRVRRLRCELGER